MKKLVIVSIIIFCAGIVFCQTQTKELTLQDAIKLTLENNLDLQIEKYNPEIADEQIAYQKGVFTPTFTSNFLHNGIKSPSSSDLTGATSLIDKEYDYNFGINYQSIYGTNASLSFQNARSSTNSIFTTINPRFNSQLILQITQPLLRNFGKENVQYFVIQAKNNKDITDSNYKQKVIDIIYNTQQAYWNTAFAYANYEVQKTSLDLARKLLGDTQSRVDVGSLAPIEVLSAKAQVASLEQQLITAENLIRTNENILKTLIDSTDDPHALLYRIKPIDKPEYREVQLDLTTLVETAFKQRPDLQITETTIKSKELDERHYHNALLPSLNLSFGTGLTGLGGTQLIYSGDIFNRVLIGTIPGGYGDALSQMFGGTYNNWSIGFQLNFPIFRAQEKANYRSSQLQKDQAVLQKKRLRQLITLQIENSMKDIELNAKTIDAAKVTTALQEEKLRAEEKKLAVGLSTNYFVLQYQNDLATAKSNELSAIVNYNKSLAQLEHAISAPLPGSVLQYKF
jgi:outer membrane protein